LKEGRPGRSRPRERRKGSSAVPVGAGLRDLVRRLGIATRLNEYRVLTEWGEIVGEQIARVAVAERIERGILFVAVASPVWRTELSLRRVEIRERINTALQQNVVKEVRFR
jgi:predicted nucleic acid-binding Zn ribbon protein